MLLQLTKEWIFITLVLLLYKQIYIYIPKFKLATCCKLDLVAALYSDFFVVHGKN